MLPNLSRLAATGGVRPLATTHSPESPTAWASFATGVNPGKHNIYDFLVRDTATYLPDLGMVRREPARFLFDYIPIAKPKLFSIRGGTSFWVTAGQAGVRSIDPDGPGDVSPRRRAKRRAPVRPAPARHPRNDGDVLLLRHRPEPLRGRQHRVRRHPQASADGAGRRQDRARRPAQPDRPRQDPGDPDQRADAERSGSRDGCGAPGPGRRPRADDGPLESRGEDRDGRNRRRSHCCSSQAR